MQPVYLPTTVELSGFVNFDYRIEIFFALVFAHNHVQRRDIASFWRAELQYRSAVF